MVNRKRISEETKTKIANSMRKHFSRQQISPQVKKNIIVEYVICYIEHINKDIQSDINKDVFINKRGEYLSEDNVISTKDLSIYDFQIRLNKQ